jgi:hypothetical protein
MGSSYSFSAGTAFSIASPSDCKCNTTDNEKKGFVSGVFIFLILTLIVIGVAFYYKVLGNGFVKLGIYILLITSIVFSALLYFDSCKCEKSEYGKYDGIGYPLLAIGSFIFIQIIYGFASKATPSLAIPSVAKPAVAPSIATKK